jgi:hypothetical protein
MKVTRVPALFAAASLALAFSVAINGCGGSSSSAPTPTPNPTPVPATKSPLQGLVAMGDEGFNTNPALTPNNNLADPITNPNIYIAAVILVTWNQLQPTGPTSFDTSAIDTALANITAYNSTHASHPLVGKLRVFAGINTPAWAMNLDGPPVTGTINGVTASFPRYWTANYTSAWTNLQNLLAARYDTNPLIGEVAVSGCSSTTAEPFIHAFGTTVTPLIQAAGYTDAQYMTCLSSMATQYAAWTHTPLDYTFNTFTALDSGNPVSNSAFTLQVMSAWRTSLGSARGVIANHGLQPTLTSDALAIYPEFVTLGPPIEFQSYGPTVNWDQTVALAVTYKATELEIWTTTQAGGQAVISLAQLQAYAAEI